MHISKSNQIAEFRSHNQISKSLFLKNFQIRKPKKDERCIGLNKLRLVFHTSQKQMKVH